MWRKYQAVLQSIPIPSNNFFKILIYWQSRCGSWKIGLSYCTKSNYFMQPESCHLTLGQKYVRWQGSSSTWLQSDDIVPTNHWSYNFVCNLLNVSLFCPLLLLCFPFYIYYLYYQSCCWWFVYFFNSFYYPLDVNILFPYSLFFLPIIFWFKRGREKLVLPEVKMWDKQRMLR